VAQVSRRLFLGATGVTVAAFVLGEASAGATAPASLTRSAFRPLVGTTATLSGPAGQLTVVLEQLTDLIGTTAGSESQFSLIFRPVGPAALPDGIYTLSHVLLGQRSLFVSRIDRGANQRYQAVVNNAPVRRAAMTHPVAGKRSAPLTRRPSGAKK
jgi:hypothetical protein